MIIPLDPGHAHFRFRTTLDGVTLGFRFDWLTRWGYFHVTITRAGETLVAGRGLHPDIDLLEGLGLGIGRLYIDGEAPTPDNLGVTNTLRYEP